MIHIVLTLLTFTAFAGAAPLVFEGNGGPGTGKHIVFLAGDHEYRSEESLPELARIFGSGAGETQLDWLAREK